MLTTAATTENGASAYEGSGAGGKFRRKPFRKPQATPYDRPPIAVRNPSSGNGWLSKIVDPASKIITASAHRLFSSVFRKRLLPPPPQQQTPPPTPAARQSASEVNRTTNSESRSEIQDKVADHIGTDHHAKERNSLDNNRGNHGIYELEEILSQKTFTKSEINQLTALLNSRTIEATSEKAMRTSEVRTSNTVFENGNLKESMSTPVPDNAIDGIRYPGATSSNIPNTKAIDEDVATPVELAKAYMGGRPSKAPSSILRSRGQAIRNDLPLINSVMFPSRSPSTSTTTKSLSRLGAAENGYMTPRSRGRSAIYSMARTPYSRMQKSLDIRSVSNHNFHSPQLALEANKLSGSRQTALKRPSYVLDDDIGFVGPTRRIRQRPGLVSSQRFTGPAGGNSSVNGPGVLSNYSSNDAGNGTPFSNFMSVPSQSSDVAQKILQQLDKLSPSPKEKSSERKSIQLPGKSTFTLTPDMLSGQALRSLEKIDSFKFIESSQENGKVSDSVQRVTTNVDSTNLNDKNQSKENGPKRLASVSKNSSESALNSSDCPLFKNTFQMSACEDYLDADGNTCRSTGTSFALAEDKVTLVKSSLENNPQSVNLFSEKENSVTNDGKAHVSFCFDNKSGRDQTVPNGFFMPEKKDKVSKTSGCPTMTIQPNATDNVASSVFCEVSSNEQITTTPLFGHGAKVYDKMKPFTFLSSSPFANDSLSLQTSALSESRTLNLSGLSDTPKTKPDDNKDTQGTGDMDGKPSTASLNGVSTTSTLFLSGSFANNGFPNGSLALQPATASSSAPLSNVNGGSVHTQSSFISPATTAGITAGGVSLFSTSAAPFSASPVFGHPSSIKDPQVTSNVEETAKPVTAVINITSNAFGGTTSATANSAIVISELGSSMSSRGEDNQGLGSVTNIGATASVSQTAPFQFGSSGFSSAPTFGLSGTTTFAPASAMTSLPAPTFGLSGTTTFAPASAMTSLPAPAATFVQNSLPSSKEAGTVGSTGGSTNSLFGSNWQSTGSTLFGSATSSSMAPQYVSQFGSSAALPASIPSGSSSTPGSLFTGSSAASTFSFTWASTSTSPSPFSASQPVFGSSNPASQPVFGSSNPASSFGKAASLSNSSFNNNQMSMEDTMAEDTVQAPPPTTPVFGQPQSVPNSGFIFGSPSPSVTPPGTGLFQFGSQPSPAPAPTVNQSPFQASGSFNAGGSFSLGTGGGDKSGRKIIKVKRGPKRR